jgi:hypothetical protein
LAAVAARCGAIRTRAVTSRTTVLLLRARMHLDVVQGGAETSLLAEECIVAGYRGQPAALTWLSADEPERLLAAEPAGNVPPDQRRVWLEGAIAALPELQAGIAALVRARAEEVLAAHQRVRSAARLRGVRTTVRPVLPADVLGLYVFMPAPGGLA